ncbi:MAG: signal peptide peptidase SppA, partial [Candidatus Gastranaerophilales bacterium]|nr:signal peptide peptidase SppA [Candidatus Gastranaerophilales bacterium]
MSKRIIASAIIGLCLLSLIIGIINTVVTKGERSNEVSKSKNIKNIFSSRNKIALISLQGAISSEISGDFLGDKNSAENTRKALVKAIEDSSVKGILLKINSPGGTVGMSQEIYSTILRLREKKPVVVSMADLAASGGYYIASAADRIYAEPGSLVGSIGVIMNTINAQNLLNNKLGIQSTVIKSGKFKDLASPYRPITSEEKELLQNLINNTYDQFLDAITRGRIDRKDNYKVKKTVLTVETLKKYADGRVFTGQIAQKLGFVDSVGGIYEAQNAVREMAKSKYKLSSTADLPIVNYNKPSGFRELFL